MEQLQRRVMRPSGALIDHVAGGAGITHEQARLLLRAAGPDLLESYRWQAEAGRADAGDRAPVRDVLSVMNARKIGPAAGLSPEKTWAGLRLLVPAVLEPGPTAH